MTISIASRKKWPVASAMLISETTNLQMHIRELLRGYAWKMDDPPASAEMGLACLENGSSFFLIVEDTHNVPAYESIRTIMNHPAGRLTPILVLLLESSISDTLLYQKVLHVGVTKKPLTPNLFAPAFSKYVQLWETPIYVALRKCAYWLLNGEVNPTIEALTKLNTVPQAVPLATQALVRIYIQKQEWKEAETVLLDSIKRHPRLPSLVHMVGNFYLEARMPAQALRFYMKLKSICNNSSAFNFDIAQAAIALGQIDVAVTALSEWNATHPGSDTVSQYLARLYMAEGREPQLERLFFKNQVQIKRIQEVWEKYENSGPPTQHLSAS